jgi:hypothetical protein
MCPNNVNRIGSRRGPILSVDVMVFQRAEIPGRAVIPHRALLQAASRVCPDAPAIYGALSGIGRPPAGAGSGKFPSAAGKTGFCVFRFGGFVA